MSFQVKTLSVSPPVYGSRIQRIGLIIRKQVNVHLKVLVVECLLILMAANLILQSIMKADNSKL